MSDKKAVIKISSDVGEAKKGIDAVNKQLEDLANRTKKSSFMQIAGNVSTIGRAFTTVTTAVKKVSEAIKENIELAQKQQKAELQLQAAAKNNPYLTDASVVQLKNYASELQSISTIGDEELLPMMSQLAAAGRTQAEIQDIMSAALDLSASGMMSMDSAVSALNASLQGNAGALGKQISGIKELTSEELKSGKAIEIVKKQFSGMSETISEQTGGWQKYKNSLGDFKEILGSGWAKIQNSVGNVLSNFFDSITSKIKAAKKEAEEFKAKLNIIATNNSDESTSSTIQAEIDLLNKENETYEMQKKALLSTKKEFLQAEKEKLEALRNRADELEKLRDEFFEENYNGDVFRTNIEEAATSKYLEEQFAKLHPEILTINEDIEKQEKIVKNTKKQWKALYDDTINSFNTVESLDERITENNSRLNELQKKHQEALRQEGKLAESDNINKEIEARDKLRLAYDQTIQQKKQEIALRRQAGASISEEEEAQQMLNTAIDAYVKMMGSPEFKGNKGNYAHEVEAREAIKNWAEAVAEAEKAKNKIKDLKSDSDNLIKDALSYLNKNADKALTASIDEEIAALNQYIQTLDETSEAYQELTDKKNRLAELQTEVQKKELEKQSEDARKKVAEITEVITTYVDKFADITNGIASLVRQNNQQENEEAMSELSEQYTSGIISYEEYCEKKKELDKKAAQEEYKVKMWEWTASFLQATANIAQGVAACFAQGMPVGAILAALVAASGAVQIATIVANKPKPPSFATGGIVQGSSYSGDKVRANVNSGEMILTEQQQANLWRAANSGNAGGGTVVNMPVTIENKNGSNVQSKMDKNGMRIIIDDMVNSSMQEGRYQQSMQIAQSKEKGVAIL